MPTAFAMDKSTLPVERWDDPARGAIRFRTLFSAPDTVSDEITCGVAMMAAGETFALYSQSRADVSFGLEGVGEAMIDGTPQRLAKGIALYIPGGAVHGVPGATVPLRRFHCSGTDSFTAAGYSFLHETDLVT